MDWAVLASAFAAAIAVSGCVVLLFSPSIDGILARVISGEMAQAWSLYVKFALFTSSFVGGMRLTELAGLLAQKQALGSAWAISSGQGLLELFKTITGSLTAASWALLMFFAATLAMHASSRIYGALRPPARHPREDVRHHDVPAGRL